MLKKLKQFSNLLFLTILCMSCTENSRDYVGFVSNDVFLGMKLGEFKAKEYGFLNHELSGNKSTVYTKVSDVKLDSIYSISENYYFEGEKKLEKVEYVFTMNEYNVSQDNYESILNGCCSDMIHLKNAQVGYYEGNYPKLKLLWQ